MIALKIATLALLGGMALLAVFIAYRVGYTDGAMSTHQSWVDNLSKKQSQLKEVDDDST